MLSDNERRTRQWQQHVGDFLSRELGGAPARWAEANRYAIERSWERFRDPARARRDVREYIHSDGRVWLADMCAQAGVALPDRDRIDDIVERAGRYVTERVRAFYPEVAEALRSLRARGYVLYTSSGNIEADLDGYLRAEGVRELFRTLYGSDIVNTWKLGPQFYSAILAHAGIPPGDAVMVDDSRRAVDWARASGMRALLLGRDGSASGPDVIRSLADLIAALD